jgi:hypothetical protein
MENPRLTQAQHDLDASLPAFLTAQDPDGLRGTRWVTDVDLVARPGVREGVGLPPQRIAFIDGVWPPISHADGATRISAGTVLRFEGRTFQLAGVGYVEAVWLDLIVEGGPLDGSLLGTVDDDRWLVTGSVSHRTAALRHLTMAPPDPSPG